LKSADIQLSHSFERSRTRLVSPVGAQIVGGLTGMLNGSHRGGRLANAAEEEAEWAKSLAGIPICPGDRRCD
jgi:hypothetical protein